MTLRMECINEIDRMVLQAALQSVVDAKYKVPRIMRGGRGISWPTIKEGAASILLDLDAIPACVERPTSDIVDAAYVITNKLRRGDVEGAREWYRELQDKPYSDSLETLLVEELNTKDLERLKG